MQQHTLIIGGTGMLAEVGLSLAARSEMITLIARTEKSLSLLRQRMPASVKRLHLLSLNWAQRVVFLNSIRTHVSEVGFPSLVIAWVHDDTLGPELAAAVSDPDVPCRFFHIRGSQAADPTTRADSVLTDNEIPASVRYHQVILGFNVSEARSRWLSDAEICTGLLSALRSDDRIFVVGSIEPWSARPQ